MRQDKMYLFQDFIAGEERESIISFFKSSFLEGKDELG